MSCATPDNPHGCDCCQAAEARSARMAEAVMRWSDDNRLGGRHRGIASVFEQARHEGRDDIAEWIEKRYPAAIKVATQSSSSSSSMGDP